MVVRNDARPAAGNGTGGAAVRGLGRPSSLFSIAQPHTLRPAAHPYNPLTDQRKCAGCGRRDGWRRLMAIGGAWICACTPLTEAEHLGGAMGHTCSPLCVGGAA
jgi:hypothetical protein